MPQIQAHKKEGKILDREEKEDGIRVIVLSGLENLPDYDDLTLAKMRRIFSSHRVTMEVTVRPFYFRRHRIERLMLHIKELGVGAMRLRTRPYIEIGGVVESSWDAVNRWLRAQNPPFPSYFQGRFYPTSEEYQKKSFLVLKKKDWAKSD